jgi:uncharacterized protein (TIGR01440 family)
MEFAREQLSTASDQLAEMFFAAAELKPGEIAVLGGSSSEIQGQRLGSAGSLELGVAVVEAFLSAARQRGNFLAVQACEHLNRALVVEAEAAEVYALEIVSAVPHLHAGGGLATAAYQLFRQPVLVERIAAHAGIDIGEVMIGMHLKPVAVPLHLPQKTLGEARVNAARTRPKLIGGERARY